MGLGLTLNTALTGLNTSQESLSIISNNIANANTENYARRVAKQVSNVIDGQGAGARIEAIGRQIDDFLLEAVRLQGTTLSQSSITSEYYTRIQTLLGQPDSGNSLSSTIDQFFSSLEALSTNPELNALKLNAVNSAATLVNKIKGLATSLEQLRYQADQDINTSVNSINQKLASLFKLNSAIRISSTASGTASPDLLEQRDNTLRELSGLLDVSVFFRSTGEALITTANGVSLLDENQHKLAYVPASSLQTFTNDTPLNPLRIQTVKPDGTVVGTEEILISGGVRDSIDNHVTGGKIFGLTSIRDSIIPGILDQLDNLAYTLTNTFNAVHNDGVGFPPSNTLTGTTPVFPTDEHLFSGKVQIALVKPDGTPVPSFYPDEDFLRPLTLDLSALDNGQGNSRPDIQTIIDEINQYYGPPSQRANLGPLYDIRLASRTDTLGPQASFPTNSTFTFDLELDNASSGDISVDVQNVQVIDAGAAGLTSLLPGTATLSGGERLRTGAGGAITVDFNGVASNGPYTVRVSVKVTDANGLSYYSDIDYKVNNNITGAFNDRIIANNVVSGDATIVPPETNQRYLTASLVDINGNPVAAGIAGFLKITTNSQSGDYRIALDELDSRELGQPESGGAVPASDKGFSHFFGLNNFFVENRTNADQPSATVAKSALNLSIRSDITTSPNLISLGQLTQTILNEPIQRPVTVGTVASSGNIQFTGNPAAGDQLIINGVTFTFVGAPTVNPDEIEVGGTLAQTLTNISTVLNATNAYTQGLVDNATYSDNGTDLLAISFDRKGIIGNQFTVSVNLATSGLSASVNGGTPSILASGALQGGQNGVIFIESDTAYTYELGSGNNQVVLRLAALATENLSFSAAGGLPTSSYTLSRYGAEITGYTSTLAVNADSILKQNQTLQDEYAKRLDAGSGVNIDEELANIILFQNAYSASARVIKVTGELFDILFEAV